MHLNYPQLVHKHPAHLASLVKMYLFGTVEPSRTYVKELYTPCYVCNDVVREDWRKKSKNTAFSTSGECLCGGLIQWRVEIKEIWYICPCG